jgi:hypothetical protein
MESFPTLNNNRLSSRQRMTIISCVLAITQGDATSLDVGIQDDGPRVVIWIKYAGDTEEWRSRPVVETFKTLIVQMYELQGHSVKIALKFVKPE